MLLFIAPPPLFSSPRPFIAAPTCRRYGAPPEQQEALLSALLSCRLQQSASLGGKATTAAAEWAQEVVAASQPGSRGAGDAPPLQPMWAVAEPEEEGVQEVQGAPHAEWQPVAATASLASPPRGPPAAAPPQQVQQLEQAVLAWQHHVYTLPGSAASQNPQPAAPSPPPAQLLEHVVAAWQQAGSEAGLAPAGMLGVEALGLSPAPPAPASRPSSAGMLRVVVPPPLRAPQSPAVAGWASPLTGGAASPSVYPPPEPLPWAPWQQQQQRPWADTSPGGASGSPSKYPPIHYDHLRVDATAPSPGAPGGTQQAAVGLVLEAHFAARCPLG